MPSENKTPAIRFAGFTGEWEKRRFMELAVTRRGLTFTPTDIKKIGIRVLRSSNIEKDHLVLDDNDIFVDPKVVSIPCVHENDIIITSANGSSNLVGKHAVIKEILPNSAVHGGFMLLATAKYPYFVNSLMNASWYSEFLSLFVAGGNGAIGNLRKKDLDAQEVFVPSEEREQEKIGNLFCELDTLITLHRRKCELLETLKKSMLEKLFPKEGELVPELRFTWFTGEWKKRKIKEIAHLITKGTTPLNKSKNGGINFVKIENIDKESGEIHITQKISKEEHEGYLRRSQLMENDILFSIAGTLGRVTYVKPAILPANTNQALAIIRTQEGNSRFITTFLKGKAVEEFIRKNPTTGAQPNLSLEQVGNISVSLPCKAEQSSISVYFQKIDTILTLHRRKLELLQNIKKACLEKMFV